MTLSQNVPVNFPPRFSTSFYRSKTSLQSRVSHKALQSALLLIRGPKTALWQPMSCWTGRGLQSGERGEMRRGCWVAKASIIEERNCIKSRDWAGAKLRARKVCIYTVGMCTPLAWSYTWLVCWSQQQSDSSEAEASSFPCPQWCSRLMLQQRENEKAIWQNSLPNTISEGKKKILCVHRLKFPLQRHKDKQLFSQIVRRPMSSNPINYHTKCWWWKISHQLTRPTV